MKKKLFEHIIFFILFGMISGSFYIIYGIGINSICITIIAFIELIFLISTINKIISKRAIEKSVKNGNIENFMDYHFDVVQNKNHLVVPRLVINSMPQTWQKNFAALLSEMNCTVDWPFTEIRYVVTARDSKGRMQSDPFQNWFAIPRLATRKEFRLHGIKRSS